MRKTGTLNVTSGPPRARLALLLVPVVATLFGCSGGGGGGDQTARSEARAITAFSFGAPPAVGVIDPVAGTIHVKVPYATDVTALVASFATTGRAVRVGATIQISGTTANDFSSPVVYTVVAESGATAQYTVTVEVAPSSAKQLTTFALSRPIAVAVIDEGAKTISVGVPRATSLTSLVATFTTTGASVKVGATAQVSGVTPNDFTTGVTYTVTAADGTTATYAATVTTFSDEWTWAGGWSEMDHAAVYGTKGIASAANAPGARESAVGWLDASGNLWLFGGWKSSRLLNDLWRFDGQGWAWMSGGSTFDDAGAYGTKGVAATTNVPGARYKAAACADTHGSFWLFGGYGRDATGQASDLNDLWKFDGASWTWVSGISTVSGAPTYGTKGVASAANVPGARSGAVAACDAAGNLWLFGGWGVSQGGTKYYVDDLWKFDGTSWTWVSGATFGGNWGNYGTRGVAAASNGPGARAGATAWIDAGGTLWLFGGYGIDSAGTGGLLNDLWKFSGGLWTWVSGSKTVNQAGSYGTKNVASSANGPGARQNASRWIDASGRLWVGFGDGYDGSGTRRQLADLWRFDGASWTWVSGPSTGDQAPVYGTRGIASTTSVPSSRMSATSWVDPGGNLWLYGGYGYGIISFGTSWDRLADLWRYTPN
jgi:N-acetylneuraminic acid mutarotase